MVDRLVAVDDADYRLPDPVLGSLASDVVDPGSAIGGAMAGRYARKVALNVRDFGAVCDGVHDDSDAIEAANAALVAGQELIFPPPGSTNQFYRVTRGFTITTPSVRWTGQPRDAYSVSIRSSVPGLTILTVKAGGFVAQDIHFMGVENIADGGENGAGMTVNGLELFGTVRGDIDALIGGCTFQYMNVGIRVRSRNATIKGDMFSHCRTGVTLDGIDASYHTDPAAIDQYRGNIISENRFHNVGATLSDAGLLITNTAKVIHAIIEGNFFDSWSTNHIKAVGTALAPHSGLTIRDNKHTETIGSAYDLTFVQDSTVRDIDVLGPISSRYSGDMIRITDCTNLTIDSVFGRRIGRSALVGTRCTEIRLGKIDVKGFSVDPGQVSDGVVFDSSSTQIFMRGLDVSLGAGNGFTGNPTNSTMIDSDFRSVSLARINSNTVLNHSRRGSNGYVEGRAGRVEDTGYGQYDLAAGVAREIAVATVGGNFGSMFLEIELTGRASTGDAFFIGRRVVRPENGTPVITTVGTDGTSGMTVTITASGTAGVSIKATTATATYIGARVRASAGGGASAANSRAVTVTMASQP